MGSQRDRAPSLGELHQELEAEQEAQVVSDFGVLGLYVFVLILPRASEPSVRIDPPSASAITSNPATNIIHTSRQLHSTR